MDDKIILDRLVTDIELKRVISKYMKTKPRYVPNFVYYECIKQFLYIEYEDPGKISSFVELCKKNFEDERVKKLSKEIERLGYNLIKR